MIRKRLVRRLVGAALAAVLVAPPALLAQRRTLTATLAPLPQASPESVGFAPRGLDKMDEAMQGLIDQKHLAEPAELLLGNPRRHAERSNARCEQVVGHDVEMRGRLPDGLLPVRERVG